MKRRLLGYWLAIPLLAPLAGWSGDVWCLSAVGNSRIQAQTWYTNSVFPSGEIQRRWSEDYFISDLNYADGVWGLLMTRGAGITAQEWRTRTSFPSGEIQALWQEGFFITELTYGDGVWALVMSKGSGYTEQQWRTTAAFPALEYEALKALGYYLTTLTYGDGRWALVMSRGTPYQEQELFSSQTYPTARILEYQDQGYTVTELNHGNGLWALAVSEILNSDITVPVVTEAFPRDGIEALWKAGSFVSLLTTGYEGPTAPEILNPPMVSDGVFSCQVATIRNTTYSLYYVPSLLQEWTNRVDQVVGDGATLTLSHTNLTDQGFYQVVAE